jgi:3-oxoacyl-[acyl-carrier protein] reductase
MSEPTQPGRVAVITGSSSGIGAATARRLAADGFHLVVHTARNRDGGEGVVQEVSRVAGCQATLLMCDFEDSRSLEHFVDECFAWRGRVDLWVNNAGADVLTGDAGKLAFEEKLDRLLKVDVVATLLLSRLAGARMAVQTPDAETSSCGHLINIGWDQAEWGMAGDSGQLFGVSKGAVMAATRSLAQTLAPAVRVNCVAPGWIRTAWGKIAPQSWDIRATQDALLGRWGQPEDVASAISFLAGEDGQFINGIVLQVNGGFRVGGEREPL